MKRIALLSALAMAIPAAAYAWPIGRTAQREEPPRTYARDRDRDAGWNRERYERYENSHWARDFHSRWAPLARGYSANSDRQFIHIGGTGRYRKLRIESVRGEPVLLKIAIEFTDKTTQAVEYRESLPAGTGEVIDLNGGDRRINRIIVYTDPHSRGAYSVYGA
jgi:hypothetical protein